MKGISWISRRSARKRQDLDNYAVAGKWEFNFQTDEIHCSSEALEIYQFPVSNQTMRSQAIVEVVHPDDRVLVAKFWRQFIHGQKFCRNFTYRIIRNGMEKFVQHSAEYVHDNEGHVVGAKGTVRDVTALMQNDITRQLVKHSMAFYENCPVACVVLDNEMGIVRFNEMAEEIFGWKERDLLFKQIPYHPPSLAAPIAELNTCILNAGGIIWFDTYRLRRDGSPVEVRCSLSGVRNSDGKVIAVAGTYEEISTGMAIPESAEDTGGQFQAFIRNSSDVYLIVDEKRTITYVSPAIERVLGYTQDEVRGMDCVNLVEESDKKYFENIINDMGSEHDNYSRELKLQGSDGELHYCTVTLQILDTRSGLKNVAINLQDITEKKHANELASYAKEHDHLTQFSNRPAFESEMLKAIAQSIVNRTKFAVMTLSLNRFQYINDNLGHSVGDKILQLVAGLIREKVSKDCICGRTSGDEFSILLPYISNREVAFSLANSLLEGFGDPFEIDDYSVYLTVGIGISFYPEDGTDVDTLMKNTHIAMHRAKQRRKNALQAYSPVYTTGSYKEFTLSNDIRTALANGDFVLYYQARVDSKFRRVVAAEALLRWDHPEWGVVSPDEFIPIAEDSGLIVELGHWVLRAVCAQLHQWTTDGHPVVKLSVNISAQQLVVHNFVEIVEATLTEYDVRPQWIEFEITETSVMPNDPAVLHAIQQLRELGVEIYFDDFGTGYSSLSWLHQFQFDGIKLDRSFVSHLPHAWAPTAIVSSVIQLAHTLNLTVVAEGVDSVEQLDFLTREGCDQIQGYLYSKPIPIGEFEQLLRSPTMTPMEVREMTSDSPENRRKFFRVQFPRPLIGEFTLVEVHSKKLKLAYTKALILDVGPGGLSYVSNLRLPSTNDVILQFRFRLLNANVEVNGHIVWVKELRGGIYQYGVQFVVDEATRNELITTLNHAHISINASRLKDFELYTGDMTSFFEA